jgi:general secretion pathway protein K
MKGGIENRMNRSGSVIAIALVTILFAAAALTLFLERAATEIIVQGRQVRGEELRVRGHSALQATLGVLHEFQQMDGELHSPAQGWGDPLTLAGWDPERDGEVTVEFVDESGRFPINRATREPLVDFFETLGLETRTAEDLADNLLEWRGGLAEGSNPFQAAAFDYESQPIPYTPPKRDLRSYSELLLIRGFAEHFADEGLPNERFRNLVESATLQDIGQVNVNSATDAVLVSWLGLSDIQAARLRDEQKRARNPGDRGYFQNTAELERITGAQSFAQPTGASIQVLRIIVRVKDGAGEYPVTAVVRLAGQGSSGGSGSEGSGGGGGSENPPEDSRRPPGVPPPPSVPPPDPGGSGGRLNDDKRRADESRGEGQRTSGSSSARGGFVLPGTGFRLVQLTEGPG